MRSTPSSILRRAGPWAISTAVHGLVAVAAIVSVTGVSLVKVESPPAEAVYTVAIQPGGGERLAGDLASEEGKVGIPADEAVAAEEAPLDGIPELELTRAETAGGLRNESSPASAPRGLTSTFRNGSSTRIGSSKGSPGGVAGGGGSSGTGEGLGLGEGRGAGIEATPLETPPPAYPEAARKANKQGAVSLEVRIDDQGRVETARVTASSGSDLLDNAAVATVLRWKYRPATLAGKPQPSVRNVRFVFRLE